MEAANATNTQTNTETKRAATGLLWDRDILLSLLDIMDFHPSSIPPVVNPGRNAGTDHTQGAGSDRRAPHTFSWIRSQLPPMTRQTSTLPGTNLYSSFADKSGSSEMAGGVITCGGFWGDSTTSTIWAEMGLSGVSAAWLVAISIALFCPFIDLSEFS